VGRRRVLAGGTSALANGQLCTFSWGPFSGPIRITGVWLDLGTTTQSNGCAGLFYSPDASKISGATATPIQIPTGWQALTDFSLFDGGANVDKELYLVPWGIGSTALVWAMNGLLIDVVGVNFYLKCVCVNRTAAPADPHIFIAIEEDPPDLDASKVDVRPPIGTGQGPEGIEGQPATQPQPAPPPPPPPVVTPPSSLPPADVGTLPAIKIDPLDPLTSASEVYRP
jgi:hypothetical protein